MDLKSSAFKHFQKIPKKYTCQGENINPPLEIENIPKNAKSLVLIVDDPDAPKKTFVHWVVYNIPIIKNIKENSTPGLEGMNDFNQKEYGGPCPPRGSHRYFFKLYAVDTNINLKERATKEEVLKAIESHVIASSELVGLYEKS